MSQFEDGPAFAAVLSAAKAGDDRAFERLYRALYRRALAFVRVRGSADPEALVQEVFLTAYAKLHTFDGNEAQFGAWIFRMTRNKLIDDHRRRNRRPQEAGGLTPVAEPHAPDDVEREVSDQLETESLLARLDMLTPDQRDVVVLRVVADLTIVGIAEVLGKEPGAIKALQRRAFRAIARNPYPSTAAKRFRT